MTYKGNNVVTTRPGTMIGMPGQTGYANLATALLAVSPDEDTRRHWAYVVDNTVYVLQGNTSGTGGYKIFTAPTYDPTNLAKTGNVALYKTSVTHTNGTLLVAGDYVYMYGCTTETTAIYRAPLSSPQSWADTGATLPFTIGGVGPPMAVVGDTIYAFGDGGDGSGDEKKIFTAPLATPTVFSYSGFTLPGDGRIGSGLAVTPTHLFLYGGSDGLFGSVEIFRASIEDPLTWTYVGDFPDFVQTVSTFVSDNYIYVLGVLIGSPTNSVYRSPIADGVNFTQVYNMSNTTVNQALVESNGRVYLYGGLSGATYFMQEASVADLDNNVASPWSVTTRLLPSGRFACCSWSTDDTFYLYGGLNTSGATTSGAVQTCALNGVATDASRSPADFSTTTTPLPTAIAGWQVVRIDDTLWFYGGLTAPGTFSTKVFSAPISAPQTLTQVHATNGPSSAHWKAFIYNGHIYGVGGDNMVSVIGNGMFKCPITDPGGLWVSTGNTLPTTLSRYSLAVIGNYVYLFGGCTAMSGGSSGTNSAVVYRSLLSELDTVGSSNWVSVTALANASANHIMAMGNGYIYLIGGDLTNAGSISTVQSCLISELAGGVSNFRNLGDFCLSGTAVAGGLALYSDGDCYVVAVKSFISYIGTTTIFKTTNKVFLKTFGDLRESEESVPAISLGAGNVSSYSHSMQSGNFPWLYARTT